MELNRGKLRSDVALMTFSQAEKVQLNSTRIKLVTDVQMRLNTQNSNGVECIGIHAKLRAYCSMNVHCKCISYDIIILVTVLSQNIVPFTECTPRIKMNISLSVLKFTVAKLSLY